MNSFTNKQTQVCFNRSQTSVFSRLRANSLLLPLDGSGAQRWRLPLLLRAGGVDGWFRLHPPPWSQQEFGPGWTVWVVTRFSRRSPTLTRVNAAGRGRRCLRVFSMGVEGWRSKSQPTRKFEETDGGVAVRRWEFSGTLCRVQRLLTFPCFFSTALTETEGGGAGGEGGSSQSGSGLLTGRWIRAHGWLTALTAHGDRTQGRTLRSCTFLQRSTLWGSGCKHTRLRLPPNIPDLFLIPPPKRGEKKNRSAAPPKAPGGKSKAASRSSSPPANTGPASTPSPPPTPHTPVR